MGLQKIKTEQEFKEAITCADGKPCFVQFSAEWCGPCQSIEGNMDEFGAQFADKMTFRYLDADAFEDIFAEYEIASMPTFVVFKADGSKAQMYGTKLDKIKDFITSFC